MIDFEDDVGEEAGFGVEAEVDGEEDEQVEEEEETFAQLTEGGQPGIVAKESGKIGTFDCGSSGSVVGVAVEIVGESVGVDWSAKEVDGRLSGGG